MKQSGLLFPPTPLPDAFRPESVRYRGEHRRTLEMSKDIDCMNLLLAVQNQLRNDARKVFMLSAVRLTEKMSPRIFEVLRAVVSTLRLEVEPEIYVRHSPDLNAGCASGVVSLQETKPILCLTSGLVEKTTPDELVFVLGHELGHWIFKHHEFSAPNILQFSESASYPYQSMKLMSWSRASEISCDRIGLLCCQNFNTAARTFFKLASGLGEEYIDTGLRDFWGQVVEATKTSEGDPQDLGWFSTHPFHPYRLRALHHFWSLDEVRGIWKGAVPAQTLTRDQMDQMTDRIVQTMDPDYLNSEDIAKARVPEFMAWAGALVMGADGKIDPRELRRLRGFVSEQLTSEVAEALKQSVPPQEIWEKCCRLAVPLQGMTGEGARTQMLANLLAIAASDQDLDRAELVALQRLGELMNLNPAVLPTLLEQIAPGGPGRGWSRRA